MKLNNGPQIQLGRRLGGIAVAPIASVSSTPAPEAPIITAPTASQVLDDTTPTITWDAVADADSYEVEFRLNGELTGTPTATGIMETSHTPAAQMRGKNYQVQVRARNSAGASDWSDPVSFSIQLIPSTNLLYWFDPSRDVYTDTALIIPAADGDLVGGYKDQGANAFRLTQSGSGKPVYRTNPLGDDLPALQFANASSQFLSCDLAAPILGNLTTYNLHVVIAVAGTTDTINIVPLSETNSGDNNPAVCFFVNFNTAGVDAGFHRGNLGTPTAAPTDGASSDIRNLKWHVLTLRRVSTSDFRLLIDGTEVGSVSANVSTATTNRLTLGALIRISISGYFTGYIADAFAHSADNYASVLPGLGERYGITMPPFNNGFTSASIEYNSSIDAI